VADTTRLPLPLVEHWEWQVRAACRGMDTATFFHPVERNAAREDRIAAAKAVTTRPETTSAPAANRPHAARPQTISIPALGQLPHTPEPCQPT
jgi:hypothetical protein